MLSKHDLPSERLREALNQSSGEIQVDIQESPTDNFETSFIRRKRFFGNHRVCCWINDEPRCTVGPQWGIFSLAWLLLLAIGGLVFFFVSNRSNSSILKWTTLGLTVWEELLFIYLALKNQGIVTAADPTDTRRYELAKLPMFCSRCNILRDQEIFHCNDCNVCVRKQHHHCVWIGKCIGQGNICAFYLFVASTVCFFVFCIGVTLFESLKSQFWKV